MKHFTTRNLAALALGLSLALTGCSTTSATSGAGASAEAPAMAGGTAAKVADADTKAAAWVEYVRNRATTLGNKADDDLVSTARAACADLSSGQIFEEVVHKLTTRGLPKAQESDQILVLGTGIVQFCPEYQPDSTGDSTADFLAGIRAAAPSIAHNSDSAILSQARTACPNAKEGPAGGAKVVSVSRKAWGHAEGYKFAFLSVAHFCSGALDNIAVNK